MRSCSDIRHPDEQDALNLRCFEQKRRFGLDFTFPIERYVAGLTRAKVPVLERELDTIGPGTERPKPAKFVDNPIFSDLSGGGAKVRDPSLVVVTSIVGVPWQDIATNINMSGSALDYKSVEQMRQDGTFDAILGDPHASPPARPLDPLMVSSIEPRTGEAYATGEPLAPPTAPRLANSINGHERTNTERDDLQYSCIFPLIQPRDCENLDNPDTGCDCEHIEGYEGNPLCQAPDGSYGTTQYFAKAYPTPRHIELIRDLGARGRLASACARNVDQPEAPDFGYRPAVDALIEQFTGKLE